MHLAPLVRQQKKCTIVSVVVLCFKDHDYGIFVTKVYPYLWKFWFVHSR